MEYFIGSIVTLALMIILIIVTRPVLRKKITAPTISQSRTHVLAGQYLLSYMNDAKPPLTQATKHLESVSVKVFILGEKAYWIKDSKVFVADIVDNEVDSSDGVEVDIIGMSDVELKKMLFIIDKLKED